MAARSKDLVSSPTFVYHQRYQGTIDQVDLYRVHTDPRLRARTGIDELLADVPGWLIIEWPLIDLVYPIDIPVIHLTASGAPAWSFTLTTTEDYR